MCRKIYFLSYLNNQVIWLHTKIIFTRSVHVTVSSKCPGSASPGLFAYNYRKLCNNAFSMETIGRWVVEWQITCEVGSTRIEIPSRNVLRGTDENHEKPLKIAGVPADIRIKHFQNTGPIRILTIFMWLFVLVPLISVWILYAINIKIICIRLLFLAKLLILSDRLCGLVVRVPSYRSRGPGFWFLALPDYLRNSRSQPREYNWGATWKKK
jgi:hypothetical protein